MKTLQEHIELLREFNRWRRGEDDDQPMPDVTEIRKAIDAVCGQFGNVNKMMRLRETPETDAAFIDELDVELVAAGSGRWKGDTKMELVPADFARKLERERDEAREQIAELLRCHHDEPCTVVVLKQDAEIKRLCKERDEAREALRQLAEQLTAKTSSPDPDTAWWELKRAHKRALEILQKEAAK